MAFYESMAFPKRDAVRAITTIQTRPIVMDSKVAG